MTVSNLHKVTLRMEKHNEVQSLLSTSLKQLNFVDISNCVNLIDSP